MKALGLDAKQEAAAIGTPGSEIVDFADEFQAASTPPVKEIGMHDAEFEPVFNPASALPVLLETGQRDDFLANAADLDLEHAQIALLPRLREKSGTSLLGDLLDSGICQRAKPHITPEFLNIYILLG